MSSVIGQKAAPVAATWVCLGIAWVMFILPIPFLSGAAGWSLNLAAFVLAIIVMSRGRTAAGLIPLLASLVISPIVYFVGVAILSSILSGGNNSEPSSDNSKNAPDTAARSDTKNQVLYVSSSDLYEAYDTNEISADQLYKGKNLEVSGVVESINSDFNDKPVVNLAAGEFYHVSVRGLAPDMAAGLGKGQSISVSCVGAGEVAGFPMLKDCSLQ